MTGPKRTHGLKVWRYMSFGRFVWMLREKALWMCRADHLGDAWEGMFSEEELQAIVKTAAAGRHTTEGLERILLQRDLRQCK
jgi:hypothetical protein